MQLINSKVEIIPQEQGLLGVYKQIELAGRTAYKSEDKITEDSAKQFVDMLIGRGHTAPLEHGTIYLKFDTCGIFNQLEERWKKYRNNPYSKVIIYDWNVYVTTNARVIYEHGWQDDLKYLCEPTEHHKRRITARFTCSRSISHELVRHRTFSFVQESTRYCNYSKSRFGNNLTFIIPTWAKLQEGEYKDLQYNSEFDRTRVKINNEWYVFEEELFNEAFANHIIDPLYFNFIEPLYYSEQNYLTGLSRGLKPQQMREILPNALKTEVVMTGFESDWNGFFKLRCDKAAHPDMQKLANELKELIPNASI